MPRGAGLQRRAKRFTDPAEILAEELMLFRFGDDWLNGILDAKQVEYYRSQALDNARRIFDEDRLGLGAAN